ncbi:hypothetical protein D347_02577 [Enterococcus faecalis LA3B-2]|nr:hypothetical protein D347_02577 [Enterococcus faecalis LA3B-2]
MTLTIESQLMTKSLTVIRQIVGDFVFLVAFPKAALFCYLIKINKYGNQLMIRHIYLFVSKKIFLILVFILFFQFIYLYFYCAPIIGMLYYT